MSIEKVSHNLEGEFIVRPYNLDIWQARAALERRKKGQKLFQIILSEDDKLTNEIMGFDKIHLLWLREPFFLWPASQGESDMIVYRADGRNTFHYYGQDNQIEDYYWQPANKLLPRHIRLLLLHPKARVHSPEFLLDANEYRIQYTGLEIYPNGETITEKTINWWKENYDREFTKENRVFLVDGTIR